MIIDQPFLQSRYEEIASATQDRFAQAVARIVDAKKRGGKVVVVTASGLDDRPAGGLPQLGDQVPIDWSVPADRVDRFIVHERQLELSAARQMLGR